MAEHHDTVIVGGGQAALAMSYHLSRRNLAHVILERHRLAERWRSERWDSLMFQMPNWWVSLPGMVFPGDEPDGFASRTEILKFIEDYAAWIAAPVRARIEVQTLRAAPEGFALETTEGAMTARQVVIATGAYHRSLIPDYAAAIPADVHQIDAASYRRPDALPEGAVLVVGSAASGSQIAEDLLRAGRRVYLSLGRHRAVPRRYRSRDLIWWLERLGRFDVTIDSLPGAAPPSRAVFTGAGGGHDLSPWLLGLAGVTLMGRIGGCRNGTLLVQRDANIRLAEADAALREFTAAADALAEQMDEPLEPAPPAPPPFETIAETDSLRLKDAGIGVVIWAIGYGHDFRWVQLPLFDGTGAPVHRRGVADWPGVYFLGLYWMHTFGSSTLPHVGRDAEFLADIIARRAAA
ncbi:MAG: FAD-dependent oxidoreductase [Cereibacter sphaeroides]|uniref:FAD-dependent oxidoreductase n=1 Tax=Cereibacter sphaeroides TaxID=1063 RepID=A0A2W5SMC4_CERSP|nr:MAG: FAD-dependent oxidoreductase [Cereibacter sphaeroides]